MCSYMLREKKLNLRVVPPILSEPFTLLYKAGKVSVRHLGYLSNVPYIAAEDSRLPLFYTIKPFEEAYNSVTFSC